MNLIMSPELETVSNKMGKENVLVLCKANSICVKVNAVLVILLVLLSSFVTVISAVPAKVVIPPYGNQGAVALDSVECADMAADMLKRSNSAVNAAITGMLCTGAVHAESSGIGGGGFMTIRDIKGEMHTVLFREKAPKAANKDMFKGNEELTKIGGLAVAVPMEVAGMSKAYELYGSKSVSWSALFQPVINMCYKGFSITKHTADALESTWESLSANLKAVYAKDGKPMVEGDIVKMPRLAKTLQAIADKGVDAFYHGDIAEGIVKTAAAATPSGILTLDDMKPSVQVADPIKVQFQGHTFYAPPAPSGGPQLHFILSLMNQYNHTSNSHLPIVYQRLIETFKFSFAERTKLGDPACDDPGCGNISMEIQQELEKMSSLDFLKAVKANISDTETHPTDYYNPHFSSVADHGTTHLSILGPDGSAVAVTTTVNSFFGSKLRTDEGIVLNDEMADFAAPGILSDGFPPSSYNYIYPGRRPLSSTCPSIAVKEDAQGVEQVSMVIGASGGKHITTAVVQAILWAMTYEQLIETAIEKSRAHHQLEPELLNYEEGLDVGVLKYFREVVRYNDSDIRQVNSPYAVVQGVKVYSIAGSKEECVEAHADSRKQGKAIVINQPSGCTHKEG